MEKIIIPPVLVLLSIILIIIFYFIFPAGYDMIPFPYNFGGILISFAGFVIMGKAYDCFKRCKTTLAIQKSTHLINEGIFLKTRNPMYLGMFLLLLGAGICFINLFSLLPPIAFLLIVEFYTIAKEEKLMTEVFGEEYLNYKKRVRKWF